MSEGKETVKVREKLKNDLFVLLIDCDDIYTVLANFILSRESELLKKHREDLEKWGEHQVGEYGGLCHKISMNKPNEDCTCGLDEALARLSKTPPIGEGKEG